MIKTNVYPRTDPLLLVFDTFDGLEEDLYGADKGWRHAIYEEILTHVCGMLLVDGGPTFGLKVLERECARMRRYEDSRGRKELGPFLSKKQRKWLMKSPGGYLRHEIDFSGPSRWTVTFD